MEHNTPLQRIRQFAIWAKMEGLCKSEKDFEQQCSLSPRYLSNAGATGKGNIGAELLGRVAKAYPQLNLTWVCTGEGPMLSSDPMPGETTAPDYRQAYEAAQMQIEALNRILRSQQ